MPRAEHLPRADRLRRAALALVLLSIAVSASAAGAAPNSAMQSTDPDAIREQVREVMARPEFSYEKSWLDRFGEWLAEQLSKLFPDVSAGGPGGTFGGGIGTLFAYVIIVLALGGVVAAVIYVVLHRVKKVTAAEDEPTQIELEHRRSADAWRDDAIGHEAAGEWKEAIRARYRLLVRTLVDRRQLPDVPGRTTGELRDDLAATTPDAAAPFDTLSLLFELPWYADAPTGADENDRFRVATDQVLAAAHQTAHQSDRPADRDQVPA